ncbi:MAG TPA: MFS transporter [Candidatus Saccharimonadales bacterium]|nr:MFS transporter [Candidatus Saccharimonadales bacterium]
MNKKQRLVLVVSILASVVSAIDGFIVNVALPTISRDLGGGLVVQQWTVDAYLLTLGSLILIAGSLSDLFGRKRILMAGLIWFGIASLLCALAPNGTFLIFARALQGIGGALLVPSSLALIISAFSGPAQGKAIGTWTAWFSVATIVGPLLGGLIVAATSWRWIFGVNVLPIAVTIWLLRQVEQPEAIKSSTKIDTLGAILCAIGLGAPVFALIEQPSYGWGNPLIWIPLAAGAVASAAFIRYEAWNKAPMLPLSLFRVRNFSAGNIATLTIYAGLSVSSFLLIITLQQVGGYSALQASVATMPISIVMFFLSGRFGALAGRYGPRLFMTAGPLTAAVGFLLMLRVQAHISYFGGLLPGLLLFALGLSMTVAPLTSAVLSQIDPKNAGVASAVNNAVARVAGLIAIALVGVITGPHLDIAGFHRALIVVAVLLTVGGISSYVGIRNVRPAS